MNVSIIIGLKNESATRQHHRIERYVKTQSGSLEGNQQCINVNKKTPWCWVGSKNREPNTKGVGEKEYPWYLHHGKQGKWVRHRLSECKAKDKSKSQGQSQATSGQPSLQVKSMAA